MAYACILLLTYTCYIRSNFSLYVLPLSTNMPSEFCCCQSNRKCSWGNKLLFFLLSVLLGYETQLHSGTGAERAQLSGRYTLGAVYTKPSCWLSHCSVTVPALSKLCFPLFCLSDKLCNPCCFSVLTVMLPLVHMLLSTKRLSVCRVVAGVNLRCWCGAMCALYHTSAAEVAIAMGLPSICSVISDNWTSHHKYYTFHCSQFYFGTLPLV